MGDRPELRLNRTVQAEHGGQHAGNHDNLDKVSHHDAARLGDLEIAVVFVKEIDVLAAKREARGGKRESDNRHHKKHTFEEVGIYLDSA